MHVTDGKNLIGIWVLISYVGADMLSESFKKSMRVYFSHLVFRYIRQPE